MKKINWVLATLAFFIVSVGYATDLPKMNVIPIETNKALVAFEMPSPTFLEITLTNCEGEILFFKRTKNRQNEYTEMLNFSELDKGNYNVCLNFGNRSISRDLKVSKNEIKVGPPERLFEPYFCFKSEKLQISFLNIPQKKVYLNLYKNGEHIRGYNLGKDMAIQKCFNLSKLEKGEYTVVLTDWFKEHKYIVQI